MALDSFANATDAPKRVGLDGSEVCTRRWFVVNTQPHKEALVGANLRRQGFEVNLPQVARVVRHARSTRRVLRPLFPRYLFIRLDLASQRWRPVLGTVGVTTLIMDGERPRAVPAGVVEALVEAADGSGGFDFRNRLRVGETVRFLAGPFADRLGRLVAMRDRERVGVLIEILGSDRVVAVEGAGLVPVDQ
jgi:transcription antitermination factor NusG